MASDFYISGLFSSASDPEISLNYRITPQEKSVFRFSVEYSTGDAHSTEGWQRLTNAVNADRAVASVLDDIYMRWKGKPVHYYDLDRILKIWKEGTHEMGIVCDLPEKIITTHLYHEIKMIVPFTDLIKKSR